MADDYEDIRECVPHSSLSSEDLEEFDTYFAGCDCGPHSLCDDSNNCTCRKHTPLAFNSDGHLKPEYLQPSKVLPPVMECGSTCGCSAKCLSRVVGRGSSFKLEPFPAGRTGTGLRTVALIPASSFVCEYVGEVISLDEAARRSKDYQGDTYIFTAQEHFGTTVTKTCVDARKKGNVARFINHSCNPNLVIVPVRVDISIPRLCLFAKRNILAGEEVTVDYGSHGVDSDLCKDGKVFSRTVCACGSENCRGFLPFEQNLFGGDLEILENSLNCHDNKS